MDDDFGDFTTSADKTQPAESVEDFLAREAAVLGDDAQLFGNSTNVASSKIEEVDDFEWSDAKDVGEEVDFFSSKDTSSPVGQMASLTLETKVDPTFPIVTSSPPQPAVPLNSAVPLSSEPLSSATPLSSNVALSATKSTISQQFTGNSVASSTTPGEESEVIKEWRERQRQLIATRDAKSEATHKEILDKAKKTLDDLHKDYQAKRDASRANAAELDKKLALEREAAFDPKALTAKA